MLLTVFLKRHLPYHKETAVLWNMLRIAWFILDVSSFSEEVFVALCTCFACYVLVFKGYS